MTPAQIARTLTKAQREAVRVGKTLGHTVRYELAELGLVDRHAWTPDYMSPQPPAYVVIFTPLGLSVRAAILASEGEG